MNKHAVGAIIIAGVLIFLASTFSTGIGNSNAAKVDSEIVVLEGSYDFGDIDIFGGKVNTTYTLKNNGDEDVNILSAVTSCMCTEGEIDGLKFGMHQSAIKEIVILAGQEKILIATYDPLAHGPNGAGKITRELTLETNSLKSPIIRAKFSANVVKNEE